MTNINKIFKINIAVLIVITFVLGFNMRVSAADSDKFSLTVTYDKNVKCNEPVTFNMEAVNSAGGTVKYYFNSVMIYHEYDDGVTNTWTSVFDPSRMYYSTDNERTFTFMASGNYWLRFRALELPDAEGNGKTQSASVDVRITINDPDYPSVEAIVQTLKTQCLASGATTDYEKALWFHDWIIHHMEYDAHGKQHKTDNEYMYVDAEGALTARALGVCESYHRGLRMLLNSVGIETARIEGNGHVWTGAKLDGTWCHIDATWDDIANQTPNAYNEHLYFGLDDRIIKLVHDEHSYTSSSPYNSNSQHYLVKTGQVATWSNDVLGKAKTKLTQQDADELTLTIDQSTGVAYGYFKVIYNLVADSLTGKTITVDNTEYMVTSATYTDKTYPNGEMKLTFSKKDLTIHTHKGIKVALIPGTITSSGTKKYYRCACGKNFMDVDCTRQITNLEEWKNGEGYIPQILSVKLSKKTYEYNGKVKEPTVNILLTNGKTLSTTHYSVTIPEGRKNIGEYTYAINFKGNYSGTVNLKMTVNPKAATISAITSTKVTFTMKWNRVENITGYQLEYSETSDFAEYTKKTISNPDTISYKFKNLLSGKKYYAKIRTYKTVAGKTYYSAWSNTVSVTTNV